MPGNAIAGKKQNTALWGCCGVLELCGRKRPSSGHGGLKDVFAKAASRLTNRVENRSTRDRERRTRGFSETKRTHISLVLSRDRARHGVGCLT